MQKKECWVLDGHQELGHVSLVGNIEEDVGTAASRQHLQERTGAASWDRVGARRGWLIAWNRAKRQVLVFITKQDSVGPEL